MPAENHVVSVFLELMVSLLGTQSFLACGLCLLRRWGFGRATRGGQPQHILDIFRRCHDSVFDEGKGFIVRRWRAVEVVDRVLKGAFLVGGPSLPRNVKQEHEGEED